MSEYQYYEFRAIDRPLTKKQMAQLRRVSSRGEITPTSYVNVYNYTDLPSITLDQIQHFFEHYKDLEPGKWVKIVEWADSGMARKMIVEGMERAAAED